MSFSFPKRLGQRSGAGTALEPLDLLLTGLSSAVAVYAAASSLSSDKNAQFFMWIVMAGTLSSALVVWFFGKSKFVLADATAYTIVALTAFFGIYSLNDLAPDAIYTGPLTMAGVLSWMLALGSFAVWRDQTMLFQAVPAVALFGLVGCYDTFRASVVYFFGFLICQAILLSRAHGRVMLKQARSSGTEALEMSVMRKGPWRWMAGPEWALASALTIVLISAIGAPFIRDSAKGFSGLVRYTPPMSPLVQSPLSSLSPSGTKVGTGPNSVSQAPVFRVKMPEAMYLRGFIYGRYDRGSWQPRTFPNIPDGSDITPANFAITAITDPVEVTFRVEPLEAINASVPVPGEVERLSSDSSIVYLRNAGGSFSTRSEPPYPVCEGTSIVFGGKTPIREAELEIGNLVPDYVDKSGIPEEVANFAREVTKDSKTDYEKAEAIMDAIGKTAKYNLNAARVPDKEDPVRYFLFQSKEGYCDLFASSMTLMARSVGLPARYVTGYYPFNSDLDPEGRYTIRGKDAHAWCEIFFKNAGWVVFDATEAATAVDGGARGMSNESPFYSTGWFKMVIIFAGTGALGYLTFLGSNRLRKYRSTLNRSDRLSAKAIARRQAQVRKQYLSFERELRRSLGRPRGIGETLTEYTSAARVKLGSRSVPAMETASRFAAALYAPMTLDDQFVESLRANVKSFKQTRRAGKSL